MSVTNEWGNSRRIRRDPTPTEHNGPEDDFEDPFDEDDPLVRRLSNLSWPPAPPEVKERVFQRLLRQLEESGGDPNALGDPGDLEGPGESEEDDPDPDPDRD